MSEPRKIDTDFFEYVVALNVTLNDIYVANIIDELKPLYIKNDNIRSYIQIIFDFYKEHSSLPNATEIKSKLINDDLKKAYKDVVIHFKTLDTQYNQDELLRNTEQFIKEKAVYYAVKETVNKVSDKEAIPDTNEILETFEKACNISLVDNLGHDYFEDIEKHLTDLTTVDKFIPTGYKWLNKMLGGGWMQSGRALYLFGGETNIGKSIVLANAAGKVVEQDLNAVIISLEMSELLYSKRISTQLSQIPTNRLKEETNLLRGFVKEFTQKHMSSKLIIKEFPPSSITTNHIKAYIQKLKNKKKFRPDVIIIDYLTLLESTKGDGSLYEDGKDISEKLRALSYVFSCPIISAFQLNRSGYGAIESPSIKSTGESMGISHTADAMMSIWCTPAEKELGILNIGMMKSRFGPNFGKQSFKIDYDTLTISETDDVFSSTEEVGELDSVLGKLDIK